MTSEMELYTLHVPGWRDNGATPNTDIIDKHFRPALLRIADGYSYLGCIDGAWRDPATGKEYVETMERYEIAATPKCMANVLRATAQAFPNEICFYVVLRGKPYFIHTARLEEDVRAMNGNVAPSRPAPHAGDSMGLSDHGRRVMARRAANGGPY
jgi:hypothetical protein